MACRSTARAAAGSWTNQFRVLLTAAAYVLMQELRPRAATPRVYPGRSGRCSLGQEASSSGGA